MTTTERTAADTTARTATHTTPRTAVTAAGDSGTWRDPGALRTLRSTYAAGRLEAEYGSVRALLTRLPESDLPAAGQLLARLDREAVARLHPDLPVVTVAVTGQSTVAPLVGPLTAQLARHGLLLDPVVSPTARICWTCWGPHGPATAPGSPCSPCASSTRIRSSSRCPCPGGSRTSRLRPGTDWLSSARQ